MKRECITILKPLTSDHLFPGALCNSVCPQNGVWYPCTIEREIAATVEDEQQMLETGDFRALQNKYAVKFQSLPEDVTT